MRVVVASENGDDNNRELPEPPPLHHDVDYVIDTWIERKNHHIYPEPGGYNDQDEYLMQDRRSMNLYHIRVHAGVYSAVPMPKQARDWRTYMKD